MVASTLAAAKRATKNIPAVLLQLPDNSHRHVEKIVVETPRGYK